MLNTIKIQNVTALLIFLSSAAALANPSHLSTVLTTEGYQEIPVKIVQNNKSPAFVYAAVECVFNNNNIGLFSLDTGATDTVVDQKIASSNQFQSDVSAGKKLSTGVDGVQHQPKNVIVPVMQCSHFDAVNTAALVRDLSFMTPEMGQPVAGLIGTDFLRRYHAIIDVSTQHLYFLAKRNPQQNNDYQHGLSIEGYQNILLQSAPSGHATIMGKVNNQPIRFLLDTGTPKTILSTDYAKQLGLKLLNPQVGKGGGGGNVDFSYAKINKISIASLPVSPQEVMVMDLKNVKIGTPIEGILGYDWLLAHQAIIDFGSNQIFVKP